MTWSGKSAERLVFSIYSDVSYRRTRRKTLYVNIGTSGFIDFFLF